MEDPPRIPCPVASVSPGRLHPGPISTDGRRRASAVAPDVGLEATVGTTGNQWARITVPSNDVMFQSVVDPATDEATRGVAGTGRLQDSVVPIPAVVVVGGAVADAHPAKDPTTRTPDTIAMAAIGNRMGRLRNGQATGAWCTRGVLHRSPCVAILSQPRFLDHDLMDGTVPCGMGLWTVSLPMRLQRRCGPAGCAGGRWWWCAWPCS
jgi:hypothetical protein